jgi:1-phosphofructokinase
MTAADRPGVAIFAPTPLLTVSIERGTTGAQEVHLHAGGQGVWVARMLRSLGFRPILCGPFGGETGAVAESILGREGVELRSVSVAAATAVNVEEHTEDARRSLAHTEPGALDRHELDDLYGLTLGAAIGIPAAVLTGSEWPHVLPTSTFRRLAADLRELAVPVVADLSADQLRAALEGGLAMVKVSDEELERDGLIADRSQAAAVAGLDVLHDLGARDVVISRGGEPTVALVGGQRYLVVAPSLEIVEPRGSGDSMTAALAAGLATGLDGEAALRLAVAAGAVNVTRHGLGGADGDVVRRLADAAVTVTEIPRRP